MQSGYFANDRQSTVLKRDLRACALLNYTADGLGHIVCSRSFAEEQYAREIAGMKCLD